MKKLFLVFLFLCVSMTASAAPVSVQFVDQRDSIPYHGVYAGYYNAKIDGLDTFVLCDDITAMIDYGQSWLANEYTYADVQSGASTKFLSTQKYSQAGWLFSQTATVTPLVRAQIQGAIWNIMDPGSIVMDSLAQDYYDEAVSGAYDTFNWGGVMKVLTPTPFATGQEFLTPIPEPSQGLLLGTGLMMLMGAIRASRRKA